MDAIELLRFVPTTLAFIIVGVILLLIAKILKDLMTPYDIAEELTDKDNPALGLSLAGYYAGVIIIIVGAIHHPGEPYAYQSAEAFGWDALSAAGYGLAGILLLNLARRIVDLLILPGFDVTKEIITDRNSGAGAVEFGSYVASGLVIAGAIHGESDPELAAWVEPAAALAFFALGQLVMIAYARFYEVTAPFNVLEEIEQDNVPAGVALGANLIAIGIVMLRALGGGFVGWQHDLITCLFDAVFGFAVFFALRILVDRVFLPGSRVEEEISRDRNINAAYIEGVVLIGGACLILFAA